MDRQALKLGKSRLTAFTQKGGKEMGIGAQSPGTPFHHRNFRFTVCSGNFPDGRTRETKVWEGEV